jgi:hypothetical protein
LPFLSARVASQQSCSVRRWYSETNSVSSSGAPSSPPSANVSLLTTREAVCQLGSVVHNLHVFLLHACLQGGRIKLRAASKNATSELCLNDWLSCGYSIVLLAKCFISCGSAPCGERAPEVNVQRTNPIHLSLMTLCRAYLSLFLFCAPHERNFKYFR